MDVSLESSLQYAESLMSTLSGPSFLGAVIVGTAQRGNYFGSQLTIGGNLVRSHPAELTFLIK